MNDLAKITPEQRNNEYLQSLLKESGVGIRMASAPALKKKIPVEFLPLPDDLINLGQIDTGPDIGINLLKLIDGRLMVQGNSGAGKSWTLRRLIEQTHNKVCQIVIDPEGEFGSLANVLGHHIIEASKFEPSALTQIALKSREHSINIVLDLSDADRERQMISVAAFLQGLIDVAREHWHPVLVFIDEAHIFAPSIHQSSATSPAVRKLSTATMTDLLSRGRKRGLCGVLATQRLARLSKSVASEINNFLIGANTLDLDIRRAAETIGWDNRKAQDRLPMLSQGDFVAVGPCFSANPAVLHVGTVLTEHRGSTPKIHIEPRTIAFDAADLLGLDELRAESEIAADLVDESKLSTGYRAVREFLRNKDFVLASKIWDALVGLRPDGASVSQLTEHLESNAAEMGAAFLLLDHFGAIEMTGTNADRAVRVMPKFFL